MEEFYSRVKGSGSLERTSVEASVTKLHHQGRFTFAADGFSKRFQVRSDETGADKTSSITPRTAFTALRKKGSDSYVVTSVGDRGYVEATLSATFEQYLRAPYSIMGVQLSEMMADPTFKITNVSEVEMYGKKAIKVKYDYWNKRLVMGPGWFVVCPDMGWPVLAFEHEFLAKNRDPRYRMAGEIEYAEPRGPIPVPRRASFLRRSGDYTDSNVYEFSEIIHGGTPDREFTGAQLGLPELDKPLGPRRRNYVSYWLLGLALAAMAAAVVARRAAGYLESRAAGL